MGEEVEVRIRRLVPEARPPEQMSELAAGFDLAACEEVCLEAGAHAMVRTGLAVAIPEGYEGQVRARSGLAARHGIGVLNAPGTIDADYRGEVRVILFNFGGDAFRIAPGDRIAQLVIHEVTRVRYVEVASLDATARGEGGFGHTGRTTR